MIRKVESTWCVLMACGAIAAIVGICLLFVFNPETTSQYPRCPFYVLTGLKCPGCGTLRGLHALMHLRFADAWHFNPLMVVSIPLICVLLFSPKLCRNALVGKIVLTVILGWWVVRNL